MRSPDLRHLDPGESESVRRVRTDDIATRCFIFRAERSRPDSDEGGIIYSDPTRLQALSQPLEGEFPVECSVYGVHENAGMHAVLNQGQSFIGSEVTSHSMAKVVNVLHLVVGAIYPPATRGGRSPVRRVLLARWMILCKERRLSSDSRSRIFPRGSGVKQV